jgi:hypothetical protein
MDVREEEETKENYINMSFIICIICEILLQ